MRITIHIDDDLFEAAKELVAQTDCTLEVVIEDALRELLERRHRGRRDQGPVRLNTVKGRGLHSGVDLDNSVTLLGLMESSSE